SHRDQSPSNSDRTAVPAEEAVVDAQPTPVSSPVASIPTQAVEVSQLALNVPGTIPDAPPPPLPTVTSVPAPDPTATGETKTVAAPAVTELPPAPVQNLPSLEDATSLTENVPRVVQPQSVPDPREPPTTPVPVLSPGTSSGSMNVPLPPPTGLSTSP